MKNKTIIFTITLHDSIVFQLNKVKKYVSCYGVTIKMHNIYTHTANVC